MRKTLLRCCVVALFSMPAATAGELPAAYTFAGDAAVRLAALDTTVTDGLIQRMVLLHNLAFKGDVAARETAEKLNKRLKKQIGETSILVAYRGSLEMIAISHQSKAQKVAGTFVGKVPWVDGPLDNLREGFEKITKAVQRDTANIQLRILRATAATEVGEHLPELLPVAYGDLLFLGSHFTKLEEAAIFFYYLSWAKYYYKRSISATEEFPGVNDWESRRLAAEYLGLAYGYASTQVYLDEMDIWKRKLSQGE